MFQLKKSWYIYTDIFNFIIERKEEMANHTLILYSMFFSYYIWHCLERKKGKSANHLKSCTTVHTLLCSGMVWYILSCFVALFKNNIIWKLDTKYNDLPHFFILSLTFLIRTEEIAPLHLKFFLLHTK